MAAFLSPSSGAALDGFRAFLTALAGSAMSVAVAVSALRLGIFSVGAVWGSPGQPNVQRLVRKLGSRGSGRSS